MFTSIIIGSGKIAAGFDDLSSDVILTHAHAYKKHKGFNLLGFYNPNYIEAKAAANKWGTQAFKSFDTLKAVDVISICTPDAVHLKSLKEAIKLEPKVIFLEKPLSNDFEEAEEIVRLSKNTPILVNYSRRFVPEFQILAKKIQAGDFGSYNTGCAYYGKGLLHNGSHMTDLINLLLGKIVSADVTEQFDDFYHDDLTKSMALILENGKKVYMQGINAQNYSIFEFDLFFEKARIRMLNAGNKFEIYEVKENEKYKGYKNLDRKEIIDTTLNFAMFYAIDNLYNFLIKNETLYSSVENAMEAIQCLK